MSCESRDGDYRRFRQVTPSGEQKYISLYDFESKELQFLQQQNPDVVYTRVISLGTAQSADQPLEINQNGRAVTIQGFLTANAYTSTLASTTGPEQPECSAFIMSRVNYDRKENEFPLTHGGGFRGSFNKLFLSWPAQSGVSARIIVYKYDANPWEQRADLRFQGRQDGTSIVTQDKVLVASAAATLIVPAKLTRKVATITNIGGGNIVGLGGSTLTNIAGARPGNLIQQYQSAMYRGTDALYGIAETSDTNVSVNEET